jgi:hypothetical protein
MAPVAPVIARMTCFRADKKILRDRLSSPPRLDANIARLINPTRFLTDPLLG